TTQLFLCNGKPGFFTGNQEQFILRVARYFNVDFPAYQSHLGVTAPILHMEFRSQDVNSEMICPDGEGCLRIMRYVEIGFPLQTDGAIEVFGIREAGVGMKDNQRPVGKSDLLAFSHDGGMGYQVVSARPPNQPERYDAGEGN